MYIDAWSMLAALTLCAAASLVLFNISVLRKPTVERRRALANIAFQFDMLTWTGAILISHISTDLDSAYFWYKITMAIYAQFPVFWLLVALSWSGNHRGVYPEAFRAPAFARAGISGLSIVQRLAPSVLDSGHRTQWRQVRSSMFWER